MESKNPIENALGTRNFSKYVVLLAKANSGEISGADLRLLNSYFMQINNSDLSSEDLGRHKEIQDSIRQIYPTICKIGKQLTAGV